MTQRFVETEQARDMAVRFLQSHPLPFSMSVNKGGKRSSQQNRLQRQWMNEIAEQLPEYTAEGWRGFCKLCFGVPILRSDDEEFRAAYDEKIKPLPYETKLACMSVPLDIPVTSRMNTRQKKQYLDAVHAHFSERGVMLSNPDDLKYGNKELA